MIIAFDLETTGLDRYNDEIIEIALVKFDEKTYKILDTFSSLVNPGVPIPELISNITNIFDSDVEGAPVLDELKKDILAFIGNTPLLGHNVFFDRDFFIEKGINVRENIVLDTFFLANMLCFHEKSLNLEMLCRSFNVPFSGAHRALNDVMATIRLFEKLTGKFKKLSVTKKKILKYIFELSEDQNIDYRIDYLLSEDVESIIFESFEKQILKKVGKLIEIKDLIVDKKLKIKGLESIYENLGTVEKRENQLEMTKIVFETMKKGNKSVIEAPTGLGKSFAYLIPSILHSVKTGEKVFISTKTKTLQDQLFYKDLSFLEDNIGFDFHHTKLKGRRNYMSLKGFFDEIVLDKIDYYKVNFLSKIALWVFETTYGELDELNYFGAEFGYLRNINADSALLLTDKNIYRDYEFLFKARQRVETSNIVVINHSLLFSDLKSENSIFGKIKNLVIDEAHSIEDSITESLKTRINEKNITEIFNFIENTLDKKNIKKIEFLNGKEQILGHIALIMDYAMSYIDGKVSKEQKYKNILIKKDFYPEADFVSLKSKIELSFLDIIDFLACTSEYDFTKEITSLQSYLNILKILLNKDSEDEYIKIANYHDNTGVSLDCTLLNPGNYLMNNLWGNLRSVILTSATLKISDSFDYFIQLLSLEKFQFYSFESDFDYNKQATLFIPNNLGSIKNNSKEVVHFLGLFYSLVRGKTLTLLTSFSIIRKIYTALNLQLKHDDINLYAQSIGGSKTKLMSFFMESPENSILLGTDSFWEGVDIPGEKLKYLVIHKFPFSVPSDPIFQARSVFFKDPFKDYSVPKAIIKLKQGFGRLIRSKNDKGIVILIDDRIYSTNWGKVFLEAFPKDINIKYSDSTHFLNAIERNISK
ncbi:DEAD/DEAH box helicase [Candidatus Gracilibacteria bacterium 28_42_T64]|nr:DEAD/DEAH box helicase [Candidatus Gracilibacteria bacterium 28_42_T64]